MSEDTAIVINPTAGGGRAAGAWEELADGTPGLGGARRILAADADAAREALMETLAEGIKRVITVGGDGTAHLAVNAIVAAEAAGTIEPGSVAFGLVPAGTGSDLARTLGLPREPRAALAKVMAAEPRPFDLIELRTDAGDRCSVINIASAGLSGAVVTEVNARPRRGQLSYLSATLSGILRYRPVPCAVIADGEPLYDGPFFLTAVANGRYFGKGMHVAPEADPTDGLLDVVVVPPVPLWQLPWRLPQFLTGRHVRLPMVRHLRAEIVRLEPAEGFPPFDVDGDAMPSDPADLLVRPGALRVLA
jgi:diacylglycerol kinase (ATP)